MKILLYIFIIALPLMLAACSSDDDTDSGYITVRESEIISKYYTGQDHYIYFSGVQLYHNDETGVVQNCVCDAECPNKEGHISESSISVTNSETRNIPVIRCRECKAEFDAYTGGALNDNAKGYRIKVYNYMYDKENKRYLLWQRK